MNPERALPNHVSRAAFVAGLALLCACGGKNESIEVDSGPSFDAMADGGVDADRCYEVSVSEFDASCSVNADCVVVVVGRGCFFGSSESIQFDCFADINVASLAAYDQLTAGGWLSPACPPGPFPVCIHGQCQNCWGTAVTETTGICLIRDDTGSDAGACFNIGSAPRDESCQTDTDCVLIPSGSEGQICTGQCACPANVVSAATAATIKVAVQSVMPADCPCTPPGVPRCVSNTCTLCTSGACADGG